MKDRLKRVWNEVEKLWYNPYYLWLYWSQNYWIDTESSDFDFKCIIIPTLDDLIKERKPTSEVIEFEWGQIEIKDIRNYIDSAVKVNVNFIEILNTEYYLWDWEIRKFFTQLLKEMWLQYLRACRWMMEQKWNALEHRYPSKEVVIDKFWYDPKQLCHIIRLRKLMKRYINNNYNFTHSWEEKDLLIDVKKWCHNLIIARKIAETERVNADFILKNYKWVDIYNAKKDMIKFSQEKIKEFIIKEIKWKK